MVPLLLLCAAAAPTTQGTRIDSAKKLWIERLDKAGGKFIFSEHYPTEEAIVFLTAYDFTRDDRFAKQAAIQLEYSHSREKDGLFLKTDGTTTRDYQARQIYNFYLAYRILADGRYLKWADDCAAAMIRVIPRAKHTVAGQTHTLFQAGFLTADGKPSKWNTQYIDINQNAEVALAYSLLYHDPASKFFCDERAKDIAYEELLAGMSIQDMASGKIPLTEDIPGGDTAYGAYASFSWIWCQLLWHDEKFEPHVRAAGKWFAPMMDLEHDSQRWYPTRIENGPLADWEVFFRLPVLWYCGVDGSKLIGPFLDKMERSGTAPKDWAYFDLMGIPRAFYLPDR